MQRILAFTAAWLFATSAAPAGLADITNKDALAGLRQALTDSAAAAVGKLGVENGFFGNPKVKIPLPESLQRVEGLMRAMGMKRQADELELAMNRAAEAAVADAKPLLVDASQATIEQYVTQKSLDGLYTIIADEEKAIRRDPVGAASSIVQKVFGALK